jgi:hypothetical protein
VTPSFAQPVIKPTTSTNNNTNSNETPTLEIASQPTEKQPLHEELFFDDPPLRHSLRESSGLSAPSRLASSPLSASFHTAQYTSPSLTDGYRLVLKFDVSKTFSCVYKKERMSPFFRLFVVCFVRSLGFFFFPQYL